MTSTDQQRNNSIAINLIIFLAGFTFLLYEVCWNRLLALVLGGTVTASTIVLATFMAGFGFGAFFWGRFANTKTGTGRLLAILLSGIGVLSLINYFLITGTIPAIYTTLISQGISLSLTELSVFIVSAILLFLPAFLIGGIFPLVSKIAIESKDSIATSLGRLYAFDTLGSAVGGLLTGFVFLGSLGQKNTVLLAVVINLGLAVWVLLSRKFNQTESLSAGPAPPETATDAKVSPDQTRLRQTALICTFVCGFSILCLQVFWLRMFKIYLTITSYTFALVASLAILGLFTGSLLFKRRAEKIADYYQCLHRLFISMAITTVLGLLLLIFLPEVLMLPFRAIMDNPLIRVFLLPIVAAILVVFPPSVFSGYAFPLTCRIYSAGRGSISGDVGLVLMINTIGSVIGPVMAAFVFLPLVGAVYSTLLIVVLLAGTALLVLRRQTKRIDTMQFSLYVGIAIILALTVVHPDIKILPPSFARFDRKVLFYREDVEGTLTVGQDRGARSNSKHTFVNNSSVIGTNYDAIKIVKMIGHYPFFLGLECKKALVIGFGIGVTTSAIASHPEVESIECVELVPGLRDAAVFYKDMNRNVTADPRLEFISGDGRHYLQLTPNKYDLISCDPTHPILGSGNLYTKEYFALCRQHLNPGGMVSQFLPLHKLRTEELLGIISTFHSEFPHCTVWLGHYYAMLLGSMDPLPTDFAQWTANVEQIGLDVHFYANPYHLAATLALDENAISVLVAENPFDMSNLYNTDNLSYTEFFTPECLNRENTAANLAFLIDRRTEPEEIFSNIEDKEMLNRFTKGNRFLTECVFHRLGGDNQQGLIALRQACEVVAEDEEFPFLIRLWY